MQYVEPDDGPQRYREPPPPDDRLWRHPSEINAKRPAGRRQMWVVGLVSALGASVLSTGLAVVAGNILDVGGGASQRLDTAGVVPMPTFVATRADIVAVADRVRPAIVQLKVERGRSGSGSAFFFRSEGYLLTNAHLVDGATSLTVVLSTGQEAPARLVGSDADTDLAVMKIEGGPFPVAELSLPNDLKVGQAAIAIGSPPGLTGGPSVTVGVISALHRSVRSRTGQTLMDMVQTDAPIARASSGGALVDAKGRVIGITTGAAITGTGGEGFGYASPIGAAHSAAEQLIATGKVATVWLGVEGSDLDGPKALELQVDGGAVIERVKADSPAERAGLVAGDVIVSVNGNPVTSFGMLVVAVRAHRPGDALALGIVRDNQRHGMQVTVSERPPDS